MESIIQLPITDVVPFHAYQTRGMEAGILLASVENAKEFLYNRCINYFFRFGEGKRFFDYTCDKRSWFFGQDVFYRQTYTVDMERETRAEILKKILHWLSHGIYVYGFFNEKYIPHKGAYGRQDFQHAYLIYGCDQPRELFFAMGYTDNRKFEKYTIAYPDFFNGIEHIKEPIFWLKYLNTNRAYAFDLHQVYWELRDYLFSQYTVQEGYGKHPEERYGVSANQAFRKYVCRVEDDDGYLDPRYSRFFYENKQFMLERLCYMHQCGYIGDYSEAYAALTKQSQTVHLLFLKYHITHHHRIPATIDRLLGQVNDADERILNQVFDELTQHFEKERQGNYR